MPDRPCSPRGIFIPTEEVNCRCGNQVRMHEHVIKECKYYACQRLTLGHGRNACTGTLMGTVKGIRKLTRFIKLSGAFEKEYMEKIDKEREKERLKREYIEYLLNP